MEALAADPRVLFLGQGVRDKGTFMSTTLQGVPETQRIELPVFEETQLGMSIGLALAGFVPVSVFPRWNFLLLAANQLVNHLNVMRPHVIVRVGVGSTAPLYPGPQHVGDMTEAFRQMMPNTHFERIHEPSDAAAAYAGALRREGPSVIVEFADAY
jgi:pyruvate/2-oxoglutarate/acetoin dehydrogenase E1 component